MRTVARHTAYSVEDYLRLEEYANLRHEYLGGAIYALAGGSPEHAAMAARVAVALGQQLRGRRCNVYTSDARIRVVATGLITYPDVSVVCGHEERDQEDRLALINPLVIVEVSSPGTAAYDRGPKLAPAAAIAATTTPLGGDPRQRAATPRFAQRRAPLASSPARPPARLRPRPWNRGAIGVLTGLD
jgi:Uma2 family endonuclease